MEAVHRALCLADAVGDLTRREAGDVTQHEHLPLVLVEALESLAQRLRAVEADLLMALVGRADFLEWDLPPGAQVVEGRVALHTQDPGRERNLARLVAMDCGDQLGEDVVGDVLGLVAVAHDAADQAADVIGVAHIEEVERAAIPLLQRDDGASHKFRFTRIVPGKGRTLVGVRDRGCRFASGGHVMGFCPAV